MPSNSQTRLAARRMGIGMKAHKPLKPQRKKLRELIEQCLTEEEWMRRFLQLSPEDQWKIRCQLEPKEQQITGDDGGPLEVTIARFADIVEVVPAEGELEEGEGETLELGPGSFTQ